LRRRQELTQKQLADLAEMKQSRISAMERPGTAKVNIETLIRLASAFGVGLIVNFAPFSELLRWENEFSQDTFNVVTIDKDWVFRDQSRVAEPAAQVITIGGEGQEKLTFFLTQNNGIYEGYQIAAGAPDLSLFGTPAATYNEQEVINA
jgi:transcriptional regulator with XRE-family HTH domain